MGFGVLFVGYITLLFFKVMPPAMLLGAYGMYRGLRRLSSYGNREGFLKASWLAVALMVYHGIFTVLWIFSYAGILPNGFISSRLFVLIDDFVYYGLLLVFHLFMYKGLLEISKFCGYVKGEKMGYFSQVLMGMFYIFALISLPINYLGIHSYIPLAHFICQIVWLIYTAVFIYGCYMRIATDEIIAEEERKIAEYDARYSYKRKSKKK